MANPETDNPETDATPDSSPENPVAETPESGVEPDLSALKPDANMRSTHTDMPATSLKAAKDDKVLLGTLAIMLVYDYTAYARKYGYIHGRKNVLRITFTATLAAIGASIAVPDNYRPLAILLGVIATILPMIGAYLLDDIVRFVGEANWVHNRYLCEKIRQEVFHYRTRSREYYKIDPVESDNILSANVKAIREEIQPKISLPPEITEREARYYVDKHFEIEVTRPDSLTGRGQAKLRLIEQQMIRLLRGDVFKQESIELDEFFEAYKTRVDGQRDWYEQAIARSFADTKRFYRWSQLTLLIGAIVGGVAGIFNREVIVMIAITNALAEAITSWSNLSIFGTTISIYMLVAQKLSDMQREFEAAVNDAGDVNDLRNSYITRVETALSWERDQWYEHVLREQAEIDDSMRTTLDSFVDVN